MYLTTFLASFVFVFLKAFQQLNVVHRQYFWVMPTSLAMAATEVWVVANVARTGWGWIVLAVGFGAGLGAVSAMLIHSGGRK
jgi:hypothetical protein